MTTIGVPRWRKWLDFFWPIEKHELKKLLPMFGIYSLIVFNYSILKASKDALLITAHQSSAATIPYIKTWVILPMAFVSVLIFTRLSNRFHRDKVFYIIMGGFLSFFALFTFVLYPYSDFLHPNGLADTVQSALPHGFQGLVAIFRNWTFTLFYTFSELWSTIIMSVLFWRFANEVTSIKEATRFYAVLSLGANLATILAGAVNMFLTSSSLDPFLPFGTENRWGIVLTILTVILIAAGAATLLLYNKLVKTNVLNADKVYSSKRDDSVPKMGIRKSLSYLGKSKYLICIALLVVCFQMSLNLVEVIWKEEVKLLYPNPVDFSGYMGKVLIYKGVASLIFSLFLCGQVIRRFGWSTGANVTPLMILITGMLFFLTMLFKENSWFFMLAGIFSVTPLGLTVFLGSMQNFLTNASKFTFFDATKEISYIPLSDECKLKGKAAIDGIGSRLGKSAGSFCLQILLIFFGTLSSITPYVACIFCVVLIVWLLAVSSLGKQFNALKSEESAETPSPVKEPAVEIQKEKAFSSSIESSVTS